jgi:hypothetical protein
MGKKSTEPQVAENGLKEIKDEVVVFESLVVEESLEKTELPKEDPGNKTRAFRG